jgi:hypothetical protein
MSVPTAGERTAMDGRYRALLDVSSAIAEQPTVKAVLHSLRGVLSSTCRIHGAHLYVLSGDRENLQLLEFDREADAPAITIGTKIARIGAAARVLEEQKPAFLPDVAQKC